MNIGDKFTIEWTATVYREIDDAVRMAKFAGHGTSPAAALKELSDLISDKQSQCRFFEELIAREQATL